MADTGEDREIKQRVSAHRAEVIRESKQLAERTKQAPLKENARRNTPRRSPSKKSISRTQQPTSHPKSL